MTKFLAFIATISLLVSSISAQFPKDFMWGSATASYQVEGAVKEDGRGPSVWDTFSHTPGKIANGDNGDIADDHYHLYPLDIELMKQMGLTHYRMSIAWPRIFPNGSGEVNMLGIMHYWKVFDMLLANNITPVVTLFHWDLPQALDDKYLGWLGEQVVYDFTNYADTCFTYFGRQVKHWITFNEPLSFCYLGYGTGVNAPGRCSNRSICPEGNSTTEPYICAHNVLKSHALTVALYRSKYQQEQGGVIGITLDAMWSVPLTDSPADKEAALRHLDFTLGWYAHPIFVDGDYPPSMRQRMGDILPTFSDYWKSLLKGSSDFFGLNHYTSVYVADNPNSPPEYTTLTYYRNGVPIGERADSTWLYVVPWGMRKILNYVQQTYSPNYILITENGVDAPNESYLPIDQAINDTFRVNYFKSYLDEVAKAIQLDGVKVKGYFAWSLLDNFEWADGYDKRFGVHYVNYKSPNLERIPKASAAWLANFIKQQRM